MRRKNRRYTFLSAARTGAPCTRRRIRALATRRRDAGRRRVRDHDHGDARLADDELRLARCPVGRDQVGEPGRRRLRGPAPVGAAQLRGGRRQLQSDPGPDPGAGGGIRGGGSPGTRDRPEGGRRGPRPGQRRHDDHDPRHVHLRHALGRPARPRGGGRPGQDRRFRAPPGGRRRGRRLRVDAPNAGGQRTQTDQARGGAGRAPPDRQRARARRRRRRRDPHVDRPVRVHGQGRRHVRVGPQAGWEQNLRVPEPPDARQARLRADAGGHRRISQQSLREGQTRKKPGTQQRAVGGHLPQLRHGQRHGRVAAAVAAGACARRGGPQCQLTGLEPRPRRRRSRYQGADSPSRPPGSSETRTSGTAA